MDGDWTFDSGAEHPPRDMFTFLGLVWGTFAPNDGKRPGGAAVQMVASWSRASRSLAQPGVPSEVRCTGRGGQYGTAPVVGVVPVWCLRGACVAPVVNWSLYRA